MRHSDRKTYLAVALFGAAAGAFFRGVFDTEETRTAINFALSALNGVAVAVPMFAAHLWFTRRAADWLRRRSLASEILSDGAVMIGAGTAAQILAVYLLFGDSPVENASLMPLQMAHSLVMAILFLTVTHLVRLIGPRQILSAMAGRYRRPVEERRVLLFIDLKGSTSMAEALGPVRVANLVARFFHDIDETIVAHGGEVQAYIGDEVIVSWPLERGLKEATCLRCVLVVRNHIDGLAESYRQEFGHVPQFRAALHGGPVVVSEIGRSKQQICYFGDTLNVAARLEELAKELDQDLLISGELVDAMDLPSGILIKELGEIALRGRAAPLRVVALRTSD